MTPVLECHNKHISFDIKNDKSVKVITASYFSISVVTFTPVKLCVFIR